tara:strand:- start:94 stop:324 length:231 start_codon:yes stop_codon:yes gene_type:complete
MADSNNKWEDNTAGSFYVDKDCIICTLCADLAPHSFKESKDETHDHVYKQPETDQELQAAKDAMEQCPVDAIGDDG